MDFEKLNIELEKLDYKAIYEEELHKVTLIPIRNTEMGSKIHIHRHGLLVFNFYIPVEIVKYVNEIQQFICETDPSRTSHTFWGLQMKTEELLSKLKDGESYIILRLEKDDQWGTWQRYLNFTYEDTTKEK